MAIVRRPTRSGTRYQVKIEGADGRWISETFERKSEAEARDAELKLLRKKGNPISSAAARITVSEFFERWDLETRTGNISEGWRRDQIRYFRDYIEPQIGRLRVREVTPAHISTILSYAMQCGRAPQTRLHIFNVMHRLFEDAIELFEILDRNPVKKRLRPSLPHKEARFLYIEESTRLLRHVEGKPYQTAIWLQLYLGLRVGEVQGLTWANVDLTRQLVHVRRSYIRKEKIFREYPKGKRWHSVRIPPELHELLTREKGASTSEYVVASPEGPVLCYDGYIKALRRYCREIGVTPVGTHGLRHSTAEIWLNAGATRDDMRRHYAHSSEKVTDRYIHGRSDRLENVAKVIRLFPERRMRSA